MERQLYDVVLAVVLIVGGMAEIAGPFWRAAKTAKGCIALPEGGNPCCRSLKWKTYSR